jgi:hypothetical protein
VQLVPLDPHFALGFFACFILEALGQAKRINDPDRWPHLRTFAHIGGTRFELCYIQLCASPD